MGKVLDSIVKEWKQRGLDEHPLYYLIVQAAHANDPEIDSLVERVLTEAPLCTCKSVLDDHVGPLPDDTHVVGINYRGFDPLLHETRCPLRSCQTLIIHDTEGNQAY